LSESRQNHRSQPLEKQEVGGSGPQDLNLLPLARVFDFVMAGLVPAIHVLLIHGMAKRRIKPKGKKAGRAVREKPFHPAWGAMQGMIRIMPGVDLTQPADPEWADYLDKKYGKEKSRG
jgi:hypothetical protein